MLPLVIGISGPRPAVGSCPRGQKEGAAWAQGVWHEPSNALKRIPLNTGVWLLQLAEGIQLATQLVACLADLAKALHKQGESRHQTLPLRTQGP